MVHFMRVVNRICQTEPFWFREETGEYSYCPEFWIVKEAFVLVLVNLEWHSHCNSGNLEENDFLASAKQGMRYFCDLVMHLQFDMREGNCH